MEKILIDQLRKGDEHAFKYIYTHHYSLLCRFANQFLRDSALSEEIVDDAILYLWEHRENIEITYSLRAYLLRAVRNRCLNELQSLSRREELRLSLFLSPENLDFLDTIFVEDTYPLGSLLEKELEQQLYDYIEELPAECRAVFKKSRFEHKTYEGIAAELGISINTVKYHIKNALAYLQMHFKEYLEVLIITFFIDF